MSLVSPLASHRGLYIRCHTGDIDEEPENPNMWVSFLQEADDDELNDNEQLIIIPDSAGKGYADVLKGINPSLSNFGEVTQQTQPPVFKESTTQDKMIQYQTGTFVTNCLKGKQDFSKGAEEFNKRLLEDLYLNFRKNDDGTLEMYNKDFLKRQKQVFGWIMKSFGSAILSGKSLTAISLPVIIFKSCSALEQEANCFLRAPHLLERAGTTRDITEQFKLTVAHHVSSLHLFLGVGKPFNPVVGETFQGIIGGCPIYLEQTVHHPPTSAMLMVGKNFTISALTEAVVNMNMSLFKLCRVGHQKVSFKNTNVTIRAQLPPLRAHGSLGKKTMDYGNKLYIFDVANRLYAEIVFDYEEPSLFKKSKVTQQDHFSGSIWRVNDRFAEILSHLPKKAHELDEIKFKEKDHAVELVAKLEGLWLEYLRIGEKVYWTMNDAFPYKMQYFDNPLPSDSNFRMDVLHLRQGDEGKAQETKEKIEEVQRKDKKLREKHKKSHK